MKKFLLLIFLVSPWATALYAQQDGQEAPDSYEYSGLFLRLQAGPGLEKFVLEADSNNHDEFSSYGGETLHYNAPISGAWGFHLQAGYALKTRPVFWQQSFFMFYLGLSQIQSKLRRGDDLEGIAKAGSVSFELRVMSIGAGFLFLPFNFYITSELRPFLTKNRPQHKYRRVSDGSLIEQTGKGGLGFGLTLGKDWWVSTDLRLGAALVYYYDRFNIDVIKISNPKYGKRTYDSFNRAFKNDHIIKSQYLGLALSLTYN